MFPHIMEKILNILVAVAFFVDLSESIRAAKVGVIFILLIHPTSSIHNLSALKAQITHLMDHVDKMYDVFFQYGFQNKT